MERTQKHPMETMGFISVAAITCGADTWEEIQEWGEAKSDWLSRLVPLPNGIPSHATFNRFYAALEPGSFEGCFGEWAASIAERTQGEVVSIDGKTMRGSRGVNASPAHVVTAWSSSNHVSLASCAWGTRPMRAKPSRSCWACCS
jgi:hypothetical protein